MNKTNNQTTLTDAVRTVGQLLLHRPTTNGLARNKTGKAVSVYSPQACMFCYIGASSVVSRKFNIHWSALESACDRVVGRSVSGSTWDVASPTTRKSWAQKLADYTGE